MLLCWLKPIAAATPRIGNRNDDIGADRSFAGQLDPHPLADVVDGLAADDRVGP